jgi:hypothetical protein
MNTGATAVKEKITLNNELSIQRLHLNNHFYSKKSKQEVARVEAT